MRRPIDFNAIDYRLDFRGRNKFFVPAYLGDDKRIADLLESDEKYVFNLAVRSQGFQKITHVACFGSAKPSTIEMLHEFGADFEALDDSERLPWHIAANAADPAILRALLQVYADKPALLLSKDSNSRSALHAIAMSGSSVNEKRRKQDMEESLTILLATYKTKAERIAALTEQDLFGVTPLMYAKYYGYTEILDVANSLGIDTTNVLNITVGHISVRQDYFGRLPIQEAAFDNKLDVVKNLLAIGDYRSDPTVGNRQFGKMNALHYAASGGGVEVLQAILSDKRTIVESVDEFGNTCLHLIAARGDNVMLQFALKNDRLKALLNVRNKFGETPLHALAMNLDQRPEKITARLACVATLVGLGADPYVLNNRSDNPYQVAIERKNDAIAVELNSLMSAHRVISESKSSAQGCLWSFTQCLSDLANKAKRCVVGDPVPERRGAVTNSYGSQGSFNRMG